MSFYHVANCNCPIGCCFCGESNDHNLCVVYDHVENEIYLWDVTNSSTKAEVIVETVFKQTYLGLFL